MTVFSKESSAPEATVAGASGATGAAGAGAAGLAVSVLRGPFTETAGTTPLAVGTTAEAFLATTGAGADTGAGAVAVEALDTALAARIAASWARFWMSVIWAGSIPPARLRCTAAAAISRALMAPDLEGRPGALRAPALAGAVFAGAAFARAAALTEASLAGAAAVAGAGAGVGAGAATGACASTFGAEAFTFFAAFARTVLAVAALDGAGFAEAALTGAVAAVVVSEGAEGVATTVVAAGITRSASGSP